MRATTHIAFSALVTTAAGYDPKVTAVAAAFSLLPDIDHPDSFFGRLFPFISKNILHRFGHRSITHSVFSLLFIAVSLIPILYFFPVFYVPFLLAFSSHIFIDLFNKSGIRLFSPVSKKEFISFNTQSLRIKTGSWQELVLFILLFFSVMAVNGREISLNSMSYNFSKFFKKYESAYNVYQDFSPSVCVAHLEYFNNTELKKIEEKLNIMGMTATRIYLMKNGKRVVLNKSDVSKITISKTDAVYKITNKKGKSIDKLSSLKTGGFVSGVVYIKNFRPELEETESMDISFSANDTRIDLTCALPDELPDLSYIDIQLQRRIEEIKQKLPGYQLQNLQSKKLVLEEQIQALNKKGFYRNYSEITDLNKQIDKIQNKIDSLKINASNTSSTVLEKELYRLENDVSYNYNIYIYQ